MTRSKVFGYLRSAETEPAKLVILQGELALHAGDHNLDLIEVFADMPCPGHTVRRPGFTLLLRALWRHDGASVLLPARSHISWLTPVREKLEQRVTDTGGRLHVLWADDDHPELRP